MTTYVPRTGPSVSDSDLSAIVLWVEDELKQVAGAFLETSRLSFEVLTVVPSKPREGDTVYADGTLWNPGSGRGVYAYISAAWVKL